MATATKKVIEVIELSDDDEPVRNQPPPPRRPVHNAATAARMMKQPYSSRQMHQHSNNHQISAQIPNLLSQRAAQGAKRAVLGAHGKPGVAVPGVGVSRPPLLKPMNGAPMHLAYNTIPQLVNQRTLNTPPVLMPPMSRNLNVGAHRMPMPVQKGVSMSIPRGMNSTNATRRSTGTVSAGASVAIVNERPLNLADICGPSKKTSSSRNRNGPSSSGAGPSGLITNAGAKNRPVPGQIPGFIPGQIPGLIPGLIPGQIPGLIPGHVPAQIPRSSAMQPQAPHHRQPQIPRNKKMKPPILQPAQPLPPRQIPQQMPRLDPVNRSATGSNMLRPPVPQPQLNRTTMPPPSNYNQTKFKKTSNNPQAVAIKNQLHRRNTVASTGAAQQSKPQNLTYRQQLQLQQKQQVQERKKKLELEKLKGMKGMVVEILDQRYHDNDNYEGSFLCGFGGCAQRIHNNINYFYHMWAHLARVLPYDYNDNGKYTTTGNCPLAKKRSELEHWSQCPHCFAEFDGIHKKSVHYHVVHSLHRTVDKFKSLSVCHICEMTVTKDGELSHLRQHLTKKGTLEVPYACKKCKYRGSTRMQLYNHFEERHANTTLLLCPVCTQSFNVPNNQKLKTIVSHEAYVNHIMRHFNEKNTRCPRCAVKMLTGTQAEKDRYERHVKSHFEEIRLFPRLKQVQKALLRRDLIKPGRRILPRKKTHKCAFCPTGHLEAASWNSRLFRRLICRNRNCNFSSTCKVEFSLHKVVCARKGIRRANGTYVPVARASVPLPPPPRTERTIYQCEKCDVVIELAKLGNPEVANHMVDCGGRMKALEPPKQNYVKSQKDDREEKFETDVFGLHRMENIPEAQRVLRKKRGRRRPKLPWEDVFNRAMNIPEPKTLNGDDNVERVDSTTKMTQTFKAVNSSSDKLSSILQQVFEAEKVHQVEVDKKMAKRAARKAKKAELARQKEELVVKKKNRKVAK